MGKRGSAPGKQNLRVTCPKGKGEFKYFSSPAYACDVRVNEPLKALERKRSPVNFQMRKNGVFRATCVTTSGTCLQATLQDKVHKTLPSVAKPSMGEIVARQVAQKVELDSNFCNGFPSCLATILAVLRYVTL